MINIVLDTGAIINAHWVMRRVGGDGGAMAETDYKEFAPLALLIEAGTALTWTDEDGANHEMRYDGIRYMSRNGGNVQFTVNKEVVA